MQILQTLALVDLQRDARGLGAMGNELGGNVEGERIGVLVLEPPGVGHDTAEQAGRHIGREREAGGSEEALDDDTARRAVRSPDGDVGKLLACGMMVEARDMPGAQEYEPSVLQTLHRGHVHRDEEVRRPLIATGGR